MVCNDTCALSHAKGLAGVFLVGLLALSTPAFAQTLPAAQPQTDELAMLASLEGLAADMNLATLSGELENSISAAAPSLPEIAGAPESELFDCAAIVAAAENGAIEQGADAQVSDDFLAGLANCYADSTGELPAAEAETLLVAGS